MRTAIVNQLLENMDNMHEMGKQRAFELGRPYYGMYKEDNGYYRKELPSGEKYLVTVEIIYDENEMPVRINDTIISKIND
jgi:hypothetical protein